MIEKLRLSRDMDKTLSSQDFGNLLSSAYNKLTLQPPTDSVFYQLLHGKNYPGQQQLMIVP